MKYACKNEVMVAVFIIATSKQRFMSHFDTFFFLFLSIEQTLRSRRCKKNVIMCVYGAQDNDNKKERSSK